MTKKLWGLILPDYFEEPKETSVLLYVENPEKAEKVFKDLSENGTVKMDIQEIFWADRFGMLVDQFGTPWITACFCDPDGNLIEYEQFLN